MSLSEQAKKALKGELPEDEYSAVGMELFAAGLVRLDPLADGGAQFPLTDKGRVAAKLLRATVGDFSS